MSRENFENFRRLVLADTALQERLRSVSDREAFRLLTVQIGKELGFDFTAEEVESALKDGQRAWIERWIQP
ncbi:Nif11-like leader peptide family natural product precursor [Pedosphaera parvula]|uniref:Aspartyl/asparaginyl beta-hydroxylase n=1 Tax=Pedosphaera parvula (strain Ellin514) TaxID=320771 RepID=B9XBK9_PEDPL|nr:Nif11-like leader peptide family natural product precursor [Pedosphaera parvula]EEF62894.1 aspartyl/asparaginyl beta-hydroxylase [Pedosphaera parvula Ellin514]